MNGFDAYSVEAWLVDCMTRHPPVEKRERPKQRGGSPSVFTRVLSSLTACAVLSSISVATVTASSPVTGAFPATLRHANHENMVVQPSAFWSQAIADVRSWRDVKEQSVTDPPLPF
jgi:hypothetical protein